MVSFDVESLFTNLFVKSAVQAALQRLNNTLMTRTSLTPLQIADLLEFVIKSTYFTYKGSSYECVVMGSPVSVVVANLYMEVFN